MVSATIEELPFHRLARWGHLWGCSCGCIFRTAKTEFDGGTSMKIHLKEVADIEYTNRREGAPWLH